MSWAQILGTTGAAIANETSIESQANRSEARMRKAESDEKLRQLNALKPTDKDLSKLAEENSIKVDNSLQEARKARADIFRDRTYTALNDWFKTGNPEILTQLVQDAKDNPLAKNLFGSVTRVDKLTSADAGLLRSNGVTNPEFFLGKEEFTKNFVKYTKEDGSQDIFNIQELGAISNYDKRKSEEATAASIALANLEKLYEGIYAGSTKPEYADIFIGLRAEGFIPMTASFNKEYAKRLTEREAAIQAKKAKDALDVAKAKGANKGGAGKNPYEINLAGERSKQIFAQAVQQVIEETDGEGETYNGSILVWNAYQEIMSEDYNTGTQLMDAKAQKAWLATVGLDTIRGKRALLAVLADSDHPLPGTREFLDFVLKKDAEIEQEDIFAEAEKARKVAGAKAEAVNEANAYVVTPKTEKQSLAHAQTVGKGYKPNTKEFMIDYSSNLIEGLKLSQSVEEQTAMQKFIANAKENFPKNEAGQEAYMLAREANPNMDISSPEFLSEVSKFYEVRKDVAHQQKIEEKEAGRRPQQTTESERARMELAKKNVADTGVDITTPEGQRQVDAEYSKLSAKSAEDAADRKADLAEDPSEKLDQLYTEASGLAGKPLGDLTPTEISKLSSDVKQKIDTRVHLALNSFPMARESIKRTMELIPLMETGAKGAQLTDEQVGMLDSRLDRIGKYIGAEASREVAASYAKFMVEFRHKFFGAALTDNELKSFKDVMSGLGAELPAVKSELVAVLSSLSGELDVALNVGLPEGYKNYLYGGYKSNIKTAITNARNMVRVMSGDYSAEPTNSTSGSKPIPLILPKSRQQ